MPDPAQRLPLRPALRVPVRRRELAAAALTVLFASATGGALLALLQPPPVVIRSERPVAVPLPVPTPLVAPAAPAPAPFDLAPVIDDGGLRVVLATTVEPQWLAGAGQVRDAGGVRVVTRPLGEVGQARFGRLVGARLRLLAASGGSCLAEVTAVAAVGRYAPEDLGDGQSPIDAAAAWSAADGSHLVAGDLAPLEGDCAGAVLAQPAASPPPVRAAIGEASAAETRQARELLRAAPELAERTGGGEVRFEVDAVELPGGERLLVASALAQGCADFAPVLSALYAVQADGSLHPVGDGVTVGELAAAADVDGDGHAELLVRDDALGLAILRRRAGAYQEEARTEVPIYGCRC